MARVLYCRWCRQPYEPADARVRYCSEFCRKAAWKTSDKASIQSQKRLAQSPHAWTDREAKRFWDKVIPVEDGCWVWTGTQASNGYSKFAVRGHMRYAHRLIYELAVGPISDGITLDHLCRNPGCVNPAHLDPVTHRENVLRGVSPMAKNAQKTHCIAGHEYTPENTYWRRDGRGRQCRACCLDRYYQRRDKERVS